MKLKLLAVSLAATAALAGPAVASADSCANVSRPAPTKTTTTSGPITKGNWVFLPSIDSTAPPLWGFGTPGTADSQALNLPGQHGNYTNGKTQSLLGVSANCPPGSNPNRQITHGIQSGCE